MKYRVHLIAILCIFNSAVSGQDNPFSRLDFLIGEWTGTGSGFGNEGSRIESVFRPVMDGNYIEVTNESWFDPTEARPEGEHHIDRGFISYDRTRKVIVFRQFNNEGYVNRYILKDSLSNDSLLVFETEVIENFPSGGKARWIIKKVSAGRIMTLFYLSFPGKDFTCMGTNVLVRKN